MHVMAIIKGTTASEAGEPPSEELLAAMGAFNEELADAGVLVSGEGLHPSRAGVRVRFVGDARTVVHGPFEPATELIAGFWIWRVASMDEAVAWARRCPAPMPGETSVIELRPVVQAEDFGDEFTPELREREARLRERLEGDEEGRA